MVWQPFYQRWGHYIILVHVTGQGDIAAFWPFSQREGHLIQFLYYTICCLSLFRVHVKVPYSHTLIAVMELLYCYTHGVSLPLWWLKLDFLWILPQGPGEPYVYHEDVLSHHVSHFFYRMDITPDTNYIGLNYSLFSTNMLDFFVFFLI